MKKIKVAQFGLGPIGIETIKLAAARPSVEIVGAVDMDPAKAGRQLSDLTGVKTLQGRKVYSDLAGLLKHARPEVVFHTAVSSFAAAFAQLTPIARAGINVISSCEEMLFPRLREPALAARLDRLCRKSGARVIGTGVNPGFVMDLLPIVLTAISRQVSEVHVQRVVNASTRRGPLQRKIGSGLPPAEFRRRFRAGKAGHAGLKESAALIAHALCWKLEQLKETGDAVVASHDIQTSHVTVRAGETCGLHQRAEGKVGGRTCVTLDLQMYLDAPHPHDAIQINGDPALDVVLRNGIAGDQATVAALVNTVPRLLALPPGLALVTDLPSACSLWR
jgi:2,4-diaminopentanoate dehydrogenase